MPKEKKEDAPLDKKIGGMVSGLKKAIEGIPDGKEKREALDHLAQVENWAIAGIERHK